jgi:hypothetical protein
MAHCDTSQHIQYIYMFYTWAMNDKCDGNNMKLSEGGNGFISTWMPHVSINDDQLTVHSACWQVVPTSVVVVNDSPACCFITHTLCSTVHSVCPCLVLISSTDFGLFNAKPAYIHESNKNLQHIFLLIVSAVSSFPNTVPHLHTQYKLMPCCVYSCTRHGLNFFSTCWRFPFNSPSYAMNFNFQHETCTYTALHCQLF